MADNKKKLPLVTTPKAPFRFPKLTEPDYGNDKFPKPDGEYSVQIVLDQNSKDAKDLIAKLKPLHEEAMMVAKEKFDALPVGSRKKLEKDNGKGGIRANDLFTVLYDKETEKPTGEIVFKAVMKASGTYKKGPKEGQKWTRSPVIFDAKGHRMLKPPAIWSGTVGRVSAEVSNYFIPGTGAAGIKLNLVGVQIIDLVSGGAKNASELGFSAEEGFEYEDAPAEQTFPSDDDAKADEGNF